MSGRHVITGGAGFVGSRLSAALIARGEDVVIFDSAPPAPGQHRFVPGDIRNSDDLSKLDLQADDTVYHLAARQFHGPVPPQGREDWFAEVNRDGTRKLLDAMERGGAGRLVFFSTDMTYGRPDQSPVPATHRQAPIGPYGRSKLAAEQFIGEAMARSSLSATIFRPRLIAGTGRLGILAKLFRLIALGLPVPMIGAGRNHYQMIAVDDCVAAALQAVDRGLPPGPFNLGSESPPTVRALLADVIRRAGSRSVLIPTPARMVQAVLAGLDRIGMTLLYPEQYAIADLDYVLDTSRTRAVLDWSPTRSDTDIIFDAYRHFRTMGAESVPNAGLAPAGS
ncbi:MAG: NAD(P)-dependent oxidoreductase [Sphingobium sp.]|uniref:NAD-dependent epimerase/dehydratase family protein n=1 Tax=Sphingobium sp. TaxID=1912891 RepID=UPI0029B403FD|nr:NAD(P)-dependent oxidoreductase [Sphingobium sp.]MDX3909587.1 NAD(P)-dependent oxidoreductase [Sphingobium sp.]